jgi:MFS family permease
MFTEIGLIQRLSVFLGHPVYALGVLLFTIILTTGIGSSLSDRWSEEHGPSLRLAAIAAAAIIAAQFTLLWLVTAMASSSMGARIAACIVAIAPLGLVLGCFFPLGIRLAQNNRMSETAWLWAINGVFGVLASALAVFVAIYFSISSNFWIGALCYLGLAIPLTLLAAPKAKAVAKEWVAT